MIARSIKVLAAVLVLGGLLSGPSAAATFKAGRGISLDIWITWPEEAQWSDPSVMLPFPEWRRHVGATQLETLKQAGFDMVRIPVDPAVFLSPRTVQPHLARILRKLGYSSRVDLIRAGIPAS